jgi:hypothetical protein
MNESKTQPQTGGVITSPPATCYAAPRLTAMVTDEKRRVKWWQYINSSGTHMTKVVCMDTGWSCEGNRYQVGNLPELALDEMVQSIRESYKRHNESKLSHGGGES